MVQGLKLFYSYLLFGPRAADDLNPVKGLISFPGILRRASSPIFRNQLEIHDPLFYTDTKRKPFGIHEGN